MATAEELRMELLRREALKRGILQEGQDANAVLDRNPVVPTPQSEFDKLPPFAKLGTAASDVLRIGSNAITLGGRDRFANLVGGGSPEEERAKTAEARERAGSAGLMTELLGMMLPAVGTSIGVGKAIPAISGPGLIPSLMREGTAGAIVGGTNAALEEEPVGRGAIVGGLGGLGGTLIGNTATNLLGKVGLVKDVRTPRMTMDEQVAQKDMLYNDIRKSGIQYDPTDVGKLSAKMRSDLHQAGGDVELHAPAFRRAKNFAKRNPTDLQELDTQRQLIARDVQGPHGVSEMGGILRQDIDEFIENTTPLRGGTEPAKRMVREAREANRKLKVREGVEAAVEKNKNAARESEGPFRTLLNKGTWGQSPRETELLTDIVRGEGIERALTSKIGDMASKVGSIGAGATAGGLLFGPVGAGIGATGAMIIPPISRAMSKKVRDKAVDALLDELGGGKTAPSWLKKFLKNTKGAAGVSGFDSYIDERRR